MTRAPSPAAPRRAPPAAFTLVELIVAMGVTILMFSFFITFTHNVLNQWNRFAGQLTTESQAAIILDQVGTDLGTAVIRPDGRVWLAATIQPDQSSNGDAHGLSDSSNSSGNGTTLTYSNWNPSGGTLKPYGQSSPKPNALGSSLFIPAYVPPTSATQTLTTSTDPNQPSSLPNLVSYRFGQAGVWLRMFVPVPDSNDGEPKNVSDAYRAVAYQIVRMRQTKDSQSHRYYLFRSTVRPYAATAGSSSSQARSTFSAGYDFFQVFTTTTTSPGGIHTSSVSIYNTPSNAGNSGGQGSNGGGGLAQDDAGNIRMPNIQQLIGNNVIDFGVRIWGRAYGTDGKPMDVLLFPASRSFASAPNLGFAASTEDGFTRRASADVRPDLNAGDPLPAVQPSPASGSSYTGWVTNPAAMTYGFAYNTNGTPGPVTASSGRPCVPVYADVFLRILDDDGARLIEMLESGAQVTGAVAQTTPQGLTPGQNWWQIAEAHSRVYTRRVQLLGVRPM